MHKNDSHIYTFVAKWTYITFCRVYEKRDKIYQNHIV